MTGLVEHDLEPRIAEIARLAKEVYRRHLDDAGYMFDESGNVVVNPAHPHAASGALHENLGGEQENWRIFSDGVLAPLLERFRFFYWLDRGDVGGAEHRLGSRTAPPRFTPEHLSRPDETGGAHSQLYYALSKVHTEVNEELLGLDVEPTDLTTPPVPVSGNNRDHRERDPIVVTSRYWDGHSARAFYVGMSLPFYEAASRQAEYVRELAAAAAAFRNVHDFAAYGIKLIADNCVAAFNSEGSAPFDWQQLGIAGRLIMSAVKVVKGLVKLYRLELISGVSDVVGGGAGIYTSVRSYLAGEAEREPENRRYDLNVTTWYPGIPPDHVLASCDEAITRLMEAISDYDERIGGGLEQDMNSTDSFNSQRLWLREPGEFSDDYNFDVNGETKANNHVDVAVDHLYEAGRRVLPDAAEQYGYAVQQVESCSLPVWLDHFLPRSKADFLTAQDGLAHLLRTTGTNLDKWGAELIEVARGYEEAEGENARAVGSTID